jgi:uncharacterized protein (DUF427 family)
MSTPTAPDRAAQLGIRRIEPGPDQESVWDYPRPPRLEPASVHIVIHFGGRVLAETRRALRMLETSHPPTYYLPPEDIDFDLLERSPQGSFCEWKGQAHYYDAVANGRRAEAVAWGYASPTSTFAELKDHLAFYAHRMDECRVDGERAEPQPGRFYGGWVTSKVVGPFKGGPGSWGW